MGRPEFVDISILYAIINFIGTLAVLKLSTPVVSEIAAVARRRTSQAKRRREVSLAIDILSGLLIAAGVVALLTGSLGLLRLPDLYSRTHAVGMMDTAGVGFIILGLVVHEGFTLISVKLALVGIFLFFTSPISTHAVAQVAHRSGVKPVTGKGEETER